MFLVFACFFQKKPLHKNLIDKVPTCKLTYPKYSDVSNQSFILQNEHYTFISKNPNRLIKCYHEILICKLRQSSFFKKLLNIKVIVIIRSVKFFFNFRASRQRMLHRASPAMNRNRLAYRLY